MRHHGILKAAGGGEKNYATLVTGSLDDTVDATGLILNANLSLDVWARSTIGLTSGKWYFELTKDLGNAIMVGFISGANMTLAPSGLLFGLHDLSAYNVDHGSGLYTPNGREYFDTLFNTSAGWVFVPGAATTGLYIDADDRRLYCWDGSAFAPANSNDPGGNPIYPAVGWVSGNVSDYCTINFGQNAFSFPHGTPPAGVNLGVYD